MPDLEQQTPQHERRIVGRRVLMRYPEDYLDILRSTVMPGKSAVEHLVQPEEHEDKIMALSLQSQPPESERKSFAHVPHRKTFMVLGAGADKERKVSEKHVAGKGRDADVLARIAKLLEDAGVEERRYSGDYGVRELGRTRNYLLRAHPVETMEAVPGERPGMEPSVLDLLKPRLLPDDLLQYADRETKLRIKNCMGTSYDERDYDTKNFMKIKETVIDLAWLARLYNIGTGDFYDSLTPVRILNEAVYRLDDAVEGIVSNNHGALNNSGNGSSGLNGLSGLNIFEGKMLFGARKFLDAIGRPDLESTVSHILVPIRANALREAFAFSPEHWMKDYVSLVFKSFLEPNDTEYGDIGFYFDFFIDMNRKQMNGERNKLKFISNARCRAIDIADHALDERDDAEKRIPSIMALYAYDRGSYSEKEIIKDTISSGQWNEKFEAVVDKYALDVLDRIKDYVAGINPTYRKVKAFQQRTYKIIGLARAMVIDPDAAKEYEAFYRQHL